MAIGARPSVGTTRDPPWLSRTRHKCPIVTPKEKPCFADCLYVSDTRLRPP